jgi:hypothetical protein
MYRSFLKTFKYFFQIHIDSDSTYTWENNLYRDFMMHLLKNMHPRKLDHGAIVLNELDEVLEVIFIENGHIDVGFRINDKKRFVLRLFDYSNIGSYLCMNNMKSLYIYKVASN